MSVKQQTSEHNAKAGKDGERDSSGWSAALYNQGASFVYSSSYVAPVLELLAAKPGERILDIGCGSGELTLLLQSIVEKQEGGVVVGTDFSESMIAKAKQNGVKYALLGDAQALELPQGEPVVQEKFDAAFSNAALHWCKRDPLGVLNSARKFLKPGGRIVVEMGGFMNCIGVRSTLHEVVRSKGKDPEELDPWYFPSMEDYVKASLLPSLFACPKSNRETAYNQLLVTAGFEPTHMSLNPRFTPLPSGLYEWLDLFARDSFLRDFSDEEAREIMREVEDRLRGDCRDASGKWAMMYSRLRFSAVLKSHS